MKSYYIRVHWKGTFRLESNNKVIKQEGGIMDIETDDQRIERIHRIAHQTGRTPESIVMQFVTQRVSQGLADDNESKKEMEQLAEEHQSNILVEVDLGGQIDWHFTKKSAYS